MRRGLATLLLAGAARLAGADDTAGFAATLPTAVGDVSSWQVVSGSFETDKARGSYLFYVNPARGALYQLMRYKVELRARTSPDERRRGSAERIAFVPRPGANEPMLCWERVKGEEPDWRPLVAGTAAYVLEMNTLLQVLAVHRAVRAGAPTP
jgi:hypothetical protein